MRYSTAIVAALVSVAAANPAGMIERDSPIAHYAPVAGRGLPHNRTGILPGPVKNLKNSNTTVDPDGRKAEDTRRGLTHSHTGIIPIPAKDLKNGSTTVDPDVEKAEDTRRGLTHSHTGIIPIPAKDLKNGNTTVDPDMAAAENTRREALADAGQGGPEELERRNSATSGITDCGSRHDTLDSGWVPVDDRPGPDNVQLIGYNTAKDEFCYHATHTYDGEDTVITHGQAYSDQINGITLTKGNYGHITCK